MRVLVVDDHPIARRGLWTILRESFAIEEYAEASDVATAIAIASTLRPDLVLLDMHMPGQLPAPELCRRIRTMLPDVRIVIVTAFDDIKEIRDCLAAGANGCLLKDTSEIDMTAALHTALTGGPVLDTRVAVRFVRESGGDQHRPVAPELTRREREVLSLLAEGCSNRSIARRLDLSETTVKGYVSQLLDKLHASSRLEALVRASDAGLI